MAVTRKMKKNKLNSKKTSGSQSIEQLLKLCRPMSICLTRLVDVDTQSKSKQLERRNRSTNLKVPSLQDLIRNTFKQSLKEFHNSGKKLEVNDYVIARMKGYSPWGAKIVSFTKDKRRAMCYFYGSNNNGSVDTKEIIPFKSGFSAIRLLNIRNANEFAKGIREIEIENGVPEHLSVLKENSPIQ